MTWHNYNGFEWCECDDCGAVIKGERPEFVGGHMVKQSYNICPTGCELFKTYDSNGNVIKYKGKDVNE